jgi:hypothetical protein
MRLVKKAIQLSKKQHTYKARHDGDSDPKLKRQLNGLIDKIGKQDRPHYDNISIGPELGELKMEKVVGEGEFISPKFYRMDSYVKSKGFPSLTVPEFKALTTGSLDGIEGDTTRLVRNKKDELCLEIVNMKRVKQGMGMIKRGNPEGLIPEDRTLLKTLRCPVTKRKMYKDGDSRPWTYLELIRKYS